MYLVFFKLVSVYMYTLDLLFIYLYQIWAFNYIFLVIISMWFYLTGLFLGWLHIYNQPDPNSCIAVPGHWPLLITPLHCLCSLGTPFAHANTPNFCSLVTLCPLFLVPFPFPSYVTFLRDFFYSLTIYFLVLENVIN